MMPVEMTGVLVENGGQVTLTHDQHCVGALAACATFSAASRRIRSRICLDTGGRPGRGLRVGPCASDQLVVPMKQGRRCHAEDRPPCAGNQPRQRGLLQRHMSIHEGVVEP